MGHAEAAIDIARPADEVWALIGDFGRLDWMPGIESCQLEGNDRTLSLLGMTIVERMYARDGTTRSITYGIVSGDLQVEHHEATITVTPADGGCRVTWSVDVEPDSLTAVMQQTYQGALGALQAQVAG